MCINCINREGMYLIYPGKELDIETRKQRLYHYTSFDSFVRIWLTKTLKFGEVTNMNDLFENNPSVQTSVNNAECLDAYLKEKKKYKQISLAMDYDSYTLGCMSPMMWGQYADKARGVCIEFSYKKLIDNMDNSMLHDVINYDSKLPETPTITKEDADDWDSYFRSHKKEEFFTKHNSWSKENEYRIVSKEKQFLNIKDTITAIYIAKYRSTERECIEKLLESSNDVCLKCIYKDSMPSIGTYFNVCDIEMRKDHYKYIEENGKVRNRRPDEM